MPEQEPQPQIVFMPADEQDEDPFPYSAATAAGAEMPDNGMASPAEEPTTLPDNQDPQPGPHRPNKPNDEQKEDWEALHQQGRAAISGLSLAAKGALDNRDALTSSLTMQMESADEENRKLLQDQLDALDTLVAMSQSEGRKQSDRYLKRKKLNQDQAAEMLRYMEEFTKASSALGDVLQFGIKDIIEDYTSKIEDRKGLDAGFRRELLKEIGEHVGKSDLLSMSRAGRSLAEAVADGVDLSNRKTSNAIAAEMKELMRDVAKYEDVHDVAKTLAESDLTEKDSLEELKRLGVLLEEMDGFAEEQTKLAALSKEDVERNTENIVDLKKVLWRLADRTVETKTLHTLNQIEHKFDKSTLSAEEMRELLEKQGFGGKFLEDSDKVSQGKRSATEALLQIADPTGFLAMAYDLGSDIAPVLGGAAAGAWAFGRRGGRKAGNFGRRLFGMPEKPMLNVPGSGNPKIPSQGFGRGLWGFARRNPLIAALAAGGTGICCLQRRWIGIGRIFWRRRQGSCGICHIATARTCVRSCCAYCCRTRRLLSIRASGNNATSHARRGDVGVVRIRRHVGEYGIDPFGYGGFGWGGIGHRKGTGKENAGVS